MEKFKVIKEKTYTLIKVLTKRLDTLVIPELKLELANISERNEENIILDIGLCEYCDSSGLSLIIYTKKICRLNKGVFVLIVRAKEITNVLEMVHLDTLINTAKDMHEALSIVYSKEFNFKNL